MKKKQTQMLMLCVLNTAIGILCALFAAMSDKNSISLRDAYANLCMSFVLWTTMVYTMLNHYTTWSKFLGTCMKTCIFYLALTFVTAGVLSQPVINMTAWGENLMTHVFARLLGILLALAIACVAVRMANALHIRRYKKNTTRN